MKCNACHICYQSMMESMLFVLLFIFVGQVLCDQVPIVNTKTGRVSGYERKAPYQDKLVHIYEGIPYAKPPVGQLRFQKPQPVDSWSGVYEANRYRNACMRAPELYPDDEIPQTKHFSEDCLYLTVYRPGQYDSKKLPVMMWIHGGGFESGSAFSVAYDGSLLSVIGNIIVVTINYRLGAFGFLYMGTEDAPGNMGLYDQHMALTWIRDNIEQFGGDPDQITIAGESAGSMSVGAHILSPLSKSLFKRAIMQSGAPNSVPGSQSPQKSLQIAHKMAEKLNCPTEDVRKMLECFRKASSDDIIEATKGGRYQSQVYEPIWGDAFMPIEPVAALKGGHYDQSIDLLFGNIHNEGTIFTEVMLPNYLSPYLEHPNVDKKKIHDIIQLIFTILRIDGAQGSADYYLKDVADDDIDGLRAAVGQAFGDMIIACPNVFFAETLAKTSTSNNVFAYKMTHRPILTSFKECIGYMGVCHGTDVLVLFGYPIALRGIVFPEAESQMSYDMIKAWTNFVHTGKPGHMGSVEWKPAIDKSVSNASVQHMNLGLPEEYGMVKNGYHKYCDLFWKPLIFK